MFRGILPLLFCVCAADKASSVQKHVAQVTDSLSLARFNGNSRASGMASGLRDMSLRILEKQPENNDEVVAQFQTIIDLIIDIRKHLLTDWQSDDTSLKNAENAFSTCINDTTSNRIDALEITESGLRLEHANCRLAATACTLNYTTECGHFEQWMNGRFHDCPYPSGGPVTNDKLNEWYNHVNNKAGEYDVHLGNYDEKSSKCRSGYNDCMAQQTTCTGAMETFEAAACEVKILMDTRCEAEGNCYTQKKTAFENLKDRLEPTSTQRVADAGSVDFVICVLEALRDNFAAADETVLNSAVDACDVVKTGDYSNYSNTFNDTPDEEDCDLDDHYPGTSNWVSVEYLPADWETSGSQQSCAA